MDTLMWLLILQALTVAHLTDALPEDCKPGKVVGFEGLAITTFNGNKHHELLDLQELKLIKNDWAVITARNTIFVLDLKTIESSELETGYSQIVEWNPNNSTKCALKASDRSRCNNFIRINVQLSENMFLMCGTNARAPQCREYKWDGTGFELSYVGETCSQPKSCLLDDEPSLAYVYSGGNLYTATKVGYRQEATLRRAPMDKTLPEADFGIPLTSPALTTVTRDLTLPHVSTDSNEVTLLNNPEFISAMETRDKVFVFFKETAAEQFGNGELTFSRVAQVCKNDRGGSKTFRSHKWTSFFKARLNCSVPGKNSFAFNELQHVTKPFIIQGVTTVFAAMTTPENSIWGSAICAYTMPAIEEAMTGDFMKRTSSSGTSVCWSKRGQGAPSTDPHPSSCPSENEDTRTMDIENLRFRKLHPLMKKAVQPVADQPLYMATQARYIFTALDAETEITVNDGRNVTMLYIGTSDGHLLKVIPRPFDVSERYTNRKEPGTFVEELNVYDADKCAGGTNSRRGEENKRIVTVTAVKGRNLILIGFRNCVVAVPKYLCSNYTCKKDCILSGPYCGWKEGFCIPSVGSNKGQQDFLFSEKDSPDCNLVVREFPTTYDPFVETSECLSATSLALPIAVAISEAIIVAILLFYIFINWKKKKSRRKNTFLGSDSLKRQSYGRDDALRDEGSRGPIYKGPKSGIIGSSSSATFSGSRPGSFTGQQTDGECPASSMDSINRALSRVSSSSITDQRNNEHVHVVENTDGILPPSNRDPNLNNNNLKKNIGIAYALSRTESPARRKTIPSGNHDEASEGNIRMGLAWGSSAGGAKQRQPPSWKSNSLRNRNVMSVTPMPITGRISPRRSEQDQLMSSEETAQSARSVKSDGILPQRPANGCDFPLKSPKVVSNYTEVENAENHTFRRGKSLNEPYYSEPAEPEYENLKFQRKASTPGNFVASTPPRPPPTANSNGRKFSSFTSSHFNTSWFPAPTLQEAPLNVNPMMHNRSESSTSGIISSTSSASVSDTQQTIADSTYLQPLMTSTLGRRNGAYPSQGKNARSSRRSADEGYGSEFVPSDEKRIPSNGSSESESHVYNNILQDPSSSPLFNSFSKSPDDENIIKDLDAFEWRQDSKTKMLKRKKSSKKKKNADQRSLVPVLSSPSDSENVFDESSPRGPDFSSDVYQIYHDVEDVRQCSQTLDDSFLEYSSRATSDSRDCLPGNQYAFHTLRPPGRMRQKLPRLRHGPKETEATLKAVPTPEIPKT